MQVAISLVIALVIVANVTADDVCYDPKKDFYPFMGTRSAYELIHGNGKLRPLSNSTCQPIQIWVLARHGTKYPEKSNMPKLLNITKFRDQILDNHQHGAGHLCAQDLENFRNWKIDPNINENTNEELAPQGQKDHYNLARRLKNAFPELLNPNTLNDNDFIFQSTNRQRTTLSMSSFIKGLLGEKDDTSRFKRLLTSDKSTLLLPHHNCKAWSKQSKDKERTIERKKFINGPEMKLVLANITNRLGFQYGLDYDTVRTAYDMCRYEVAWYPEKVSIWCSIFTKDDLKVFEYNEDLDYYYTRGSGREMTGKLGCELLADMYKHFKALESDKINEQPKGVFHFAHTVTLQTLMAALKIGKEKIPLTADGYATSENRSYRVSKLGPFATNVIAVFYKCPGSQPEHRVTLHVAEEPAPLDTCPDGICDWEFMKTEYGPTAESCSMEFCKTSSGARNIGLGLLITLILVFIVLL